MMGTEVVPETLVVFKELAWLIAAEDFINIHITVTIFLSCRRLY
jgi:hypothetical protein